MTITEALHGDCDTLDSTFQAFLEAIRKLMSNLDVISLLIFFRNVICLLRRFSKSLELPVIAGADLFFLRLHFVLLSDVSLRKNKSLLKIGIKTNLEINVKA